MTRGHQPTGKGRKPQYRGKNKYTEIKVRVSVSLLGLSLGAGKEHSEPRGGKK